jgi:hypothetical protein
MLRRPVKTRNEIFEALPIFHPARRTGCGKGRKDVPGGK